MFGNVVAVTFQITFRAEMHVNVFLFLKIIFDIKTIQNIQIILNFNKKKIIFFKNMICTLFPNSFLVSLGLSNNILSAFTRKKVRSNSSAFSIVLFYIIFVCL